MAYTTINKSTDYFNTVTYSGSNSSQSVTGVGFQPDWVWIKNRNTAVNHYILDSSRGLNYLSSSTTSAESSSANRFNSFDSDGFQVEHSGGGNGFTNGSGQTYVSWNWKANGGTTSSNTDGSITSTVQANTTAGFSIVTYTGNEVQGATVGHGLGTTPQWIIVKNRTDSGYDWAMWHQDLSSASYIMRLNLTSAETNSYPAFNNTLPTSTVFSLAGGSQANRYYTNKNTSNYVAYCFAEIEGYSKFGSYNAGGSGTEFIYTGFRPQWLLIKVYSSGGTNWILFDDKRTGLNEIDDTAIAADTSQAEAFSAGHEVDFYSNGFKITGTNNDVSYSGNKHLYMCFAKQPFKFSNPR